ncbi:hypothetical protein TSUD_139500 [Trifolium subterraneum]|uniref:DUF7745 domain-containing protein n=1 Tax=Trifolium subterraneum TaxID=3900 RepID=A0A2Z6PIP2_TRISU|nr:hypothetical protein TSUD_139500 [Trifolium subterraneum]
MASTRRHTPTLKVKKPQVESLKGLNYGLILNLLHVEINDMALTTLAQFYDPPLRCFTFQDFQLAPTLEEFAKILGCNLEDHGPYLGLGEEPPMREITKALHLTSVEVSSWLEDKKNDRKGVSKGFSKSVLDAKAQALLEKKDWKPFNAVLALLVYGLVLFPDVENFVDFSAIGVFIARNPVTALLADLYYSLHIKYEGRRKGIVSCCVPLLQEWLTSHLPKKDSFVSNPAGLKWHQRMMALTEKDIFWPLSPEPITMVPIEEAEELKAKIAELQKKNEEWESKYLQVEGKRARLERDLKYQEGVLQESQKSLRESEDKREKIGDGMLSAKENLIVKDEEIERLKQSCGKIKEFRQLATASQKKWRLRYLEQVEETKKIKKQWRQEEFKEQLHLEVGRKQEFENLYFQERERCEHIQAEIEHILRVYEERVARLNEELEDVNTKMTQRGVVLELVWGDSDRWRDEFAKLAAFSNMAIKDLPEKLAMAEIAMSYYEIPSDIKEFMEYCKEMVEYYKEELTKAKRAFNVDL